jgi:pimeloyl-ACP methyl ester carboxylesterase
VDTLVARASDGSRVHSRTATIDRTPIRWVESGEGPTPVVLIHGIPTSPDLWRHVTPLLDDVRVLAFEMVGYGRSIPAGEGRDISIAAQARYLDAWLDHLGLDRVVLVGHDLGGGVAQIAALERPERCAGLLLTNAIAYDSWPIPSVRAMRAVPQLVERMPPPLVKATIGSLLARGHDDVTIARESLDIHHSHYAGQGRDAGTALARQVTALDVRDTLRIADRLPDLDVPSRIVWGLDDQFQKAVYGQRLARELHARAIGIPGGKHFTPEDHPDVIASTIRELVDEAT